MNNFSALSGAAGVDEAQISSVICASSTGFATASPSAQREI